jgi:SAM-dependent methyltransferase
MEARVKTYAETDRTTLDKPAPTGDRQSSQSLMDLVPPPGIEAIDKIVQGYQAYQVLVAGLEIGLFDLLEKDGPLGREDIVAASGINGMFSRPLLNSLVDLGTLSVEDDRYSVTDIARALLVSGSESFQGHSIKNAGQRGYWNHLADSVKRDQPQMKSTRPGATAGPSPTFLDGLAEGARRGELQEVTKTIVEWDGFADAKRLLDVGGGHGLYAIALCQQNPGLNAVVLDQIQVIDTTLDYISRYGMKDRVSVQAGDICVDDLGSGYDIVLVSHLLYKFRKELDPIFARLAASLNPGGLLVSNHRFCAPGCAPEESALRELGRALHSFGHPLCHVEDFEKRLGENGLRVIATGGAPTMHGTTILQLAVKE